MKRTRLIAAFSDVCDYIADNMYDLLYPHLDDELEMITPIFNDAHITDIHAWWGMGDNFFRYLEQILKMENDKPGSRQEAVQMGINELQSYPTLLNEFSKIHDLTATPTIDVLKYLPHQAGYATLMTQSAGYKKLDQECRKMENVVVWPMVTLGAETDRLRSAFYLNAAIVSTDQKPLRPKITKLSPVIQ